MTPTAHDRIAWITRVNPSCDIRRKPSPGALPPTETAIQMCLPRPRMSTPSCPGADVTRLNVTDRQGVT
ncbi:hypothetical protein CTE05_26070 [Cellulomonas terrae]|uniref:Uncharacterized protein n=1 Tax=Cellulomonas terrae TaxID=311234 RepID=A0A511JM07_9CELL|nr:hypothetical protein CTE05_26070 [Cellulomonas terrae]